MTGLLVFTCITVGILGLTLISALLFEAHSWRE